MRLFLTCWQTLFAQVYYYHSRTREAVWTKPENVKIITQEEVEAMAAQNQQPGGANRPGTGTSTAAQAAVAQGKQFILPLLNTVRKSISSSFSPC